MENGNRHLSFALPSGDIVPTTYFMSIQGIFCGRHRIEALYRTFIHIRTPKFASRSTSGKRKWIFNNNNIELITITCDELEHVVGVKNTLQFHRFRKIVCKLKVHRSMRFSPK